MRTLILSAAVALSLGGIASAAEPIVGKWRAPDGGIVQVTSCGEGFCAKVITGQHKGTDVGQMQGAGTDYSGTVTDPRDNRTYEGSATVEGAQMKLTGCALKVFCKTQVWVRT